MKMPGLTVWIGLLTFLSAVVTESEEPTREELKEEYLQWMDKMRNQEGFRLDELVQEMVDGELESEARDSEMMEGAPRASDIWRNKVKEFLSSRLESKGVLDDDKEKENLDPAPVNTPPNTFLSPPEGDVMVGDTEWRDTFEIQPQSIEDNTDTEGGLEEVVETEEDETVEEQSLLEQIWGEKPTETVIVIEGTTEREPPAFHTTLASFQEYAGNSPLPPLARCQTGHDCKSSQVCYLPTNTCKDQLTLSLSQRSSCTQATDCNIGEVCYLPTKSCVCDLGYIEQAGECVLHSAIQCWTTLSNDTKIADEAHWGIIPYCGSWGIHPVNTGEKMSYGYYISGTGLTDDDPMKFIEGSRYSCDRERSAEMYYSCYCEEYSCTTEPEWNTTTLWWGEFDPCHYTAYVYSPLACKDKVA